MEGRRDKRRGEKERGSEGGKELRTDVQDMKKEQKDKTVMARTIQDPDNGRTVMA